MIHYLQGRIEFRGAKFLVVEAGGIGYKIFCSPDTINRAPEAGSVKIFTSLYLREDAVELYGFLTAEELELFDILNEISGIGPKTAMALASLGSLEKLKAIMESGKMPSEIKGIGQKKMQKILLELTGKIKELKMPSKKDADDPETDALVSLGFTKQKASDTLSLVPKDLSREERIKRAIKILGRR